MGRNGLEGMDVLVVAEFPEALDTVLKMVPGEYHPYVTLEALENQKNFFHLLPRPSVNVMMADNVRSRPDAHIILASAPVRQ